MIFLLYYGALIFTLFGPLAMSNLDDYLRPFQTAFGRKERLFWAKAYIEGLLSECARKTIEGIARSLVLPEALRATDTRQALQNFIQESPWDEQQVMPGYRQQIVQRLGRNGVLVIDDIFLLKQGQHSVGVHRQFCTEQRKKVNCQVVTTVFLVAAEQAAPLAMRLYLPRSWQDNLPRLAKSKVPAEYHQPASKIQIAVELLAQLRAEGLPYQTVAAADSYLRSDVFRQGVADHGMRLLSDWEKSAHPANELVLRVRALTAHLKDTLGLDHFEGRTWRGLHHHLGLVSLAHGYSLQRPLSRSSS